MGKIAVYINRAGENQQSNILPIGNTVGENQQLIPSRRKIGYVPTPSQAPGRRKQQPRWRHSSAFPAGMHNARHMDDLGKGIAVRGHKPQASAAVTQAILGAPPPPNGPRHQAAVHRRPQQPRPLNYRVLPLFIESAIRRH